MGSSAIARAKPRQRLLSLAGAVVAASWDDELSAQMMALDVRVAEEALAARILIDLQDRALPASL